MARFLLVMTVLSLAGAPVTAQSMDASTNRASIDAVQTLWSEITGYILQVAEETDAADYAYRPTAEVRSIGELIGHVAGAQYMMCAAALGDPPRAEDAVEQSAQTKTALVKELRASTEYCGTAYAQSDNALQANTKLFGMEMTRFHALAMNATHNGEHYGNLVTYLRLRGIVPPSSRGGM
jgi:uncharacterized damage-inducible protein DinB